MASWSKDTFIYELLLAYGLPKSHGDPCHERHRQHEQGARSGSAQD